MFRRMRFISSTVPACVQYESCTPANAMPSFSHARAVSIMCALSRLWM